MFHNSRRFFSLPAAAVKKKENGSMRLWLTNQPSRHLPDLLALLVALVEEVVFILISLPAISS